MLLRLQLRLPSLDSVRLLTPRLGFGGGEVCLDRDPPAVGITAQAEEMAGVEEPQRSLVRLSDRLTNDLESAVEDIAEPGAEPIAPQGELPKEAAEASLPAPTSAPPRKPPQGVKAGILEGARVAAIGFGRQDVAGLACAMIEERARIEFLPRGEAGERGEFDLLLLNCGSVDALKRDGSFFRAVLASGTPAIMVGSRAAIGVLRGSGAQAWDFASKPLHIEELKWRAVNLLRRVEEGGLPGTLPARVVVADHDPFIRTLIESALSREGFVCELAEDGEAAWAAIEESKPGAVILDLTLPNRDGFQLMADLRRAGGQKPRVIVLSARQSEADILRAFALGADDYVTKPFSPLELSARLTRLLGGVPDNA